MFYFWRNRVNSRPYMDIGHQYLIFYKPVFSKVYKTKYYYVVRANFSKFSTTAALFVECKSGEEYKFPLHVTIDEWFTIEAI